MGAAILLTGRFNHVISQPPTPEESEGATFWKYLEKDDEGLYLFLFYKAIDLQSQSLDSLFLQVADWKTAHVMICDVNCEWVLRAL